MGNKLTYPEVDLTGKVAVVTGGNAGIGYQTAKGLARLGAHTFIACRSKERAETAIQQMKEDIMRTRKSSGNAASSAAGEDPKSGEDKTENSESQTGTQGEEEVRSKEQGGDQPSDADTGKKDIKIEFLPLDLSSFQSTKEFVRLFKERNLPLHILVNNAAISSPVYSKTGDDLESQLQVNHLGPTLLTLELLPAALEAAASCGDVRIIFLTSSGHFYTDPFDMETFNKTEDNYNRVRNYGNTKMYNIMTGFCLQRRLQGKNITLSSVHPGYVRTGLIDQSARDMTFLFAMHSVAKNFVRTPTEGAATSLNCAVNPELNSQQHFYYDSCKTKAPSDNARNEEFQEQMWKKTFEFLKDHLSPETIEKYGPREEEPAQAAEGAGNVEEVRSKEDKPQNEANKEQELQNGSEEANKEEVPQDGSGEANKEEVPQNGSEETNKEEEPTTTSDASKTEETTQELEDKE